MALKKRIKKQGDVKPKKAKMTKKEVETLALEYSNISEQVKALNARKKELSEIIKTESVELGTVDDKGSHYLDTGSFICGRVAKKSVNINEEKAYDYLTTHTDKEGNSLRDCVQQVTQYVIDEDALSLAVQEGRLDVNEIREAFYDVKVSYSVSVKQKEEENVAEMSEVEKTSLKKAARRK